MDSVDLAGVGSITKSNYINAVRFKKVLYLTTIEFFEMDPQQKAVWDRLIKGGWYTQDLVALIDALPEPD
jgi:hypothetical protein